MPESTIPAIGNAPASLMTDLGPSKRTGAQGNPPRASRPPFRLRAARHVSGKEFPGCIPWTGFLWFPRTGPGESRRAGNAGSTRSGSRQEKRYACQRRSPLSSSGRLSIAPACSGARPCHSRTSGSFPGARPPAGGSDRRCRRRLPSVLPGRRCPARPSC